MHDIIWEVDHTSFLTTHCLLSMNMVCLSCLDSSFFHNHFVLFGSLFLYMLYETFLYLCILLLFEWLWMLSCLISVSIYWHKNTTTNFYILLVSLKIFKLFDNFTQVLYLQHLPPPSPPSNSSHFPPCTLSQRSPLFFVIVMSFVLAELLISLWFSFFLVDSLWFYQLIFMLCISRDGFFFFPFNMSGFCFPSYLIRFARTSKEHYAAEWWQPASLTACWSWV